MATYKYVGDEELVFPSVLNADGSVLVVRNGDEFDAPAGISVPGVSVSSKKAKASAVVEDDPEATADLAE